MSVIYLHFPIATFKFFVQWIDLGSKNPLHLAHSGYQNTKIFGTKVWGGFTPKVFFCYSKQHHNITASMAQLWVHIYNGMVKLWQEEWVTMAILCPSWGYGVLATEPRAYCHCHLWANIDLTPLVNSVQQGRAKRWKGPRCKKKKEV